MAKKTKRKINKKGILVVLLTLYLIIMVFYYCFTKPISGVFITGNVVLSDKEIIAASGIKDNIKLFSLNGGKIEKNVESLNLVESAKVRKSLNGNITIEIKELKVLFYNILNNSYVLSNNTEVDFVNNTLGVPVLINYVPSDIYRSFISKMNNIDMEIITLISEIEYAPDTKDDITIDANRFLLRMNDGNYVYINLANFDNLSRYADIYAALDDTQKGVLNLDSSSDKVLFTTFEALKKSESGEEVELPS